MAAPHAQASWSERTQLCAAIWAPGVLGMTPVASSAQCPIQLWQVSRLQTSGPGPRMLKDSSPPRDQGRGCGRWWVLTS